MRRLLSLLAFAIAFAGWRMSWRSPRFDALAVVALRLAARLSAWASPPAARSHPTEPS